MTNVNYLKMTGTFPRIVRLKDEYYHWVDSPLSLSYEVRSTFPKADLFSFLNKSFTASCEYNIYWELEVAAVLPISTYDNWWRKQINDKTRNMIRRSMKNNVLIKIVDFNDPLVHGIKEIYDESPLRQGKPFIHFNKSFSDLKEEHGSFLDRSDFIAAFYKEDLIGFIKLVHDDGVSHIMQIISKIKYRDMAPTNALLAKAVEICANRGVPLLHYSIWSRRGLGDFKKHNGFVAFELRRYYLSLTLTGKIALMLRLHNKIADLLPAKVLDAIVLVRNKLNIASQFFKNTSK